MSEMKTKQPWKTHYDAQRIDIAIETPVLRVLDATFTVGQQVPWHRHTNVVDHFWVISGRLRVETRAPDQCLELGSGGYCAVAPGCEHCVTCLDDGDCHFINLQGFGTYDFVRPREDKHMPRPTHEQINEAQTGSTSASETDESVLLREDRSPVPGS